MSGSTLLLLFGSGEQQQARPSSDVSAGGWTTHLGGTTDLWDQINEEVPDDEDFIKSSDLSTGSDTVVLALSPLPDPLVSYGHEVKIRFRKQGTATMNFKVAIMDGAEEIATWTYNGVDTDWVTETEPLTEVQADAISNYGGNLRLELTSEVAA